MKPKILLIEDETDLGNVVRQYLEIMDFEVTWYQSSVKALQHFQADPQLYHILLIDVSIPDMDGFTLAQEVVKINEYVPFLFLTARNERSDRLFGLKIGADDYVTKPFDIDELVLRIRNILKRNQHTPADLSSRNFIERGDVKFYKDSFKLYIGSHKEITLTPREAELLDFLFRNEHRILKREDILKQLWGDNDYFLGRSLDVFVSRLRKHLSKSGMVSIDNVYGVGFIFNVKGKS
ncbi:response regulator transcription factor [Chitinophaga horti]|uniref:Response regulator transcription factor n=1 Tax=Chitinophaga horti TaxID=2920382 RepID=A0ABY6J0D8_9BACT|nr:response regulator transcription factor [Chitinophaga horti]UYQ91784.1 response regulator transcription factor [Chitinophaga horti]